MDPLVYVVVAVLIGILLLVVTLLRKSSNQGDVVAEENQPRRAVPVPRQDGVPVRRRGARQRMRAAEEDSDEEEANVFDTIAQPDGKIGAKKLRKLEEKATKKAQREDMERERGEKKERDAMLDKKRKKDEEKEKIEEEIRAEEEKKLKEEEEKREYEEYLKLKEAFTVDEEGQTDILTEDQQQGLLQEFITYIKEMKVIMLEDLAAHFSLRTQDAIDRVQQLIESGDLTGVMDDRGKFIYITDEEYQAVAKFIKQRGRVSISELADSSNKLINLNPDNKEVFEKKAMASASL